MHLAELPIQASVAMLNEIHLHNSSRLLVAVSCEDDAVDVDSSPEVEVELEVEDNGRRGGFFLDSRATSAWRFLARRSNSEVRNRGSS